ncbi:MAG TPA: protein kinase [Vicinamibacterales bacterium]|nr:protein kinase [Vicinamibacterales bacterium]
MTAPAGDPGDETGITLAEDVRTGLSPAIDPPTSPESRKQDGTFVAPPAPADLEATFASTARPVTDDATVVSPGTASPDLDATFVTRPPPAAPPDVDATFAGPAVADVTMMGHADDAATLAPPGRESGSPDTDATVMQSLHDEATIAGPPRPPAERPRTSRPGTQRPSTSRPGTHRPGTNRPATGAANGGLNIQHMEPGDAFGTRYRITRMLGVGGMGAVYQAWDAELGVDVAIKTIRPGVGTDATTALDAERRFKRELLLARQVTHRNVVRIYDLGEIEGTKYITMSFVDGQDLASLLAKEGKLPLAQALPIMRQVMAGMGAAHLAGIVHRDLKPANIMVDRSGQALVMDFGIARSVEGAGDATPAAGTPALTGAPAGHMTTSSQPALPTHALTVVGSVMGTLDYMAPEQARGQPVDQRADVYALGLILRDVLLGRTARPKSGNAFEDLKQRIAEPLPSVRTVDPDFPEALDAIITRALALDPAERYQGAQEVTNALELLDDAGKAKPLPKLRSNWMLAAAGVAMIVAALGAWFGGRWGLLPGAVHEPVAVLIADFQNQTGDPTFDRTLEPVMKLALEGAGFISAIDRSAVPRSLGVAAPKVLDEDATRELAVKQGVGVVLTGTLTRSNNRFEVAVKAAEAVTGNVIAAVNDTASGKDGVLGVLTGLADDVREALGDDTSDTSQRFAMETLSATSLDVVREYANAMDALSRSQFNPALQGFSRAVALDPKFGLAYAGMAIASNNLGRQQEAENYVKQAMALVDAMTERERYRTRGMFYFITNDYQSCVKEYGDLIAKYSADAAARNNRAHCLSKLRSMPEAMEEARQVVKILPNRGLYRVNLAMYAAYSGDGPAAEQESRNALDKSPWALQSLALAQTLQGQVAQAAETYNTLAKSEDLGPSYTASGLADLALYEGRISEAVRILTQGAAADLAAKDRDRAANKFAALAYAELLRQRKPAAVAAAEKALANSQEMTIRFLAGRVLIEAGAPEKARPIAVSLGKELLAEPQAYASILEGMIAAAGGDNRNALRLLTEANTHLDTWIGHFEMGRVYLAANAFPQADSEFDRCIARRGEVLALFLDEEPTFSYFPPVYYYQGRVREGLKTAGYVDSYRAYLDIRGRSTDDAAVAEVRKRIATQ